MDEKIIKGLYIKYVKNKYFYRAYSDEWTKNIKKNGLTPKINPYAPMKKELINFFKILDYIEDNKISYYAYVHWENKPTGKILSKIHKLSLNKKYIDLTPDGKKELKYYFERVGGDIPHTVNHVANDLINYKYPITEKQKKLVIKVQKWAKEKMKYKMKKLKISATSKYLEKAEFQRFWGEKYIESPFGSFKHFKKTILKYGWNEYKKYIIGKQRYYLRIRITIPANEIILF